MRRATDSNFLIRGFFLHCYIHLVNILKALDPTHVFGSPRFPLFRKIIRRYRSGSNSLFKNIIYTYKWDLIAGGGICAIYVCFNMLLPELIRMFMHYLHGHHTEKSEIRKGQNFIKMLVGVQILRTIMGEHTRRLFHELAIKVESSLARMLVVKSLNLTQKARKDIPQSEILQLENVDLRLVWIMFNNMYFIFEAPLTIAIALILLFIEDRAYGLIAGYWFLIAFLLHRELDEHMTHCNATKLALIEKRSKINYEVLDGIKQAKLIGWEDMMVEKNNDLFEVENHDHYLFYFYNSLYDIILLMLPILVVVTIGIWDIGEAKPIKVEQVYLMLSLLGLCYEPMKEFRTISISFHDGLHSLNRIQQYFDMPEQEPNDKISHDIEPGRLVIKKGTAATYPNTIFDFFLKTDFQIEVGKGERLLVVSRRGHGRSSFINLINGFMKIAEGEVRINSNIGFLSENFFFMKSRVRDNIAFYNETVSQEEIDRVADQLGLTHDLKKVGGLNALMEDLNIFTKSQLQRIALARVLCSSAEMYILDSPYEYIDKEHEMVLDTLLRRKQVEEQVTIIMANAHLDFIEPEDQVVIISDGYVHEYSYYRDMINDLNSKISNYFKSKDEMEEKLSSQRKRPMNRADSDSIISDTPKKRNRLDKVTPQASPTNEIKLGFQMMKERIVELRSEKEVEKKASLRHYLFDFIFCVPISEILFIMLIIACAELLHVFIHFWIGHLEEEHGDNSYLSFRFMIVIEVILTLGLAGVLFFEGEVSSRIAIMQGNSVYRSSLSSLIRKRISWFASEYSVKIADRFNHDYEEIFIACHSLLGIYKNLIILIVTVFFISSDGLTVLLFFSTVAALYTTIFFIFRLVEKKVVKHYYDYKYGFVMCFEESIGGADYFRVFDAKKKLIKRAEAKYKNLASYKLAERYTTHGLSIVCDLMGIILLAAVVYYGMESNLHNNRSNLALIATSIHLLMNGSQVLKSIVKDTISFETFFLINLVPFLEINNEKIRAEKEIFNIYVNNRRPSGYDLEFDEIVLKEPGEISAKHPLSFRIKEGEYVLIFEPKDAFRDLILYALTQNIGMIQNPNLIKGQGRILIGGEDLTHIEHEYLSKRVGVIMNQNFYISGSLRENLVRKVACSDQEVDALIKELKLDEDIEDYDTNGLNSEVHFEQSKVNYELTKKFALIRILLHKCPIIVIKDTTAFVGSTSIDIILRKYIPNCTIIKLSNKIEAAIDVDRIIALDNGVVSEDGTPDGLIAQPNSEIGGLLKDANIDGFLFMNKISRAHLGRKVKKMALKAIKRSSHEKR